MTHDGHMVVMNSSGSIQAERKRWSLIMNEGKHGSVWETGEPAGLLSADVPHLKCALCRGRSGLPLGRLFKRLQSRQQGMDISKFHSTYSLPAFPPYNWFCKADGQFERGESLLSPTSCSLCLPVMGPSSSTRAPPIPPPSAPPAVQQQCDRSGRGSPESGAVSRPDLPGGAAAHPPAGCAGLHLRRAAAALSVQLGWARQVRTLQHNGLTVLQVHESVYLKCQWTLRKEEMFIINWPS